MPVSEANRAIEPFSVTAACAMLRRDDYLALGGLEEGYFYDSEDVELGEQIRVKLRKSVVCLNTQTALHHRGWYRMSPRANAVNARMQTNDGVLLRRLGHQMKKRRQRSLYSRDLQRGRARTTPSSSISLPRWRTKRSCRPSTLIPTTTGMMRTACPA
jgi:hypothetical protein